MKIFVTILIAMLSCLYVVAQQQEAVASENARIIFNGAYIVLHSKADLVIQNTSPDAFTVKNKGGVISEDAANNVVWKIGNDTGYTVPFITKDLKAIPVSFDASNETGTGSFTLSTYSGSPDWNNANYLPPGVTNVNSNGKNNSNHVIDRFWKISASGYTTSPSLKNLSFGYEDIEWNESGNAITEANLVAQNWNSKWLAAVGKDNAPGNMVKISSVNNYYTWWTLADSKYVLNKETAKPVDYNIIAQTLNATVALGQNFPNPFQGITTISYSLPQHFTSASIIISDKNGNAIKQVNLSNNKGNVSVDASAFTSGTYQYSLIIDGKLTGTKQMILLK